MPWQAGRVEQVGRMHMRWAADLVRKKLVPSRCSDLDFEQDLELEPGPWTLDAWILDHMVGYLVCIYNVGECPKKWACAIVLSGPALPRPSGRESRFSDHDLDPLTRRGSPQTPD